MNRLINRTLLFAVAVAICGLWLGFYSHGAVARQAGALMRLEASRGHFSGAVLISRGGRIIFQDAYGLANASWGIANTADTRFRVGSITKTFTAALVMLLDQEGWLSINDSICRYVNPCPTAWRMITLRHLLSHTSGIVNLTMHPDQLDVPQPRADMLERFEREPLAFVPGTHFQYSNSNYYLLGMVIEKVTGETYGAVLHDRILSPLQLRDTGLIESGTIVHELAEGYVDEEGQLTRVRPMDPTWSYAAGAMYSTVRDLARWSDAMAGNVRLPTGRPLLASQTVARMWSAVLGEYGFGWQTPAIGPLTFGRRIVEHGGSVPGFLSELSRGIGDQVTVVVLANDAVSSPERIARGLRAIELGIPYESPLLREPVVLSERILHTFVGEYQLDGVLWQIVTRNGRLYAKTGTGPELEAYPVSKSDFLITGSDLQLHGDLDAKGRVTGLSVRRGFQEQLARKLR